MLKCETNSPKIEKEIMSAARQHFGQRKDIHAVFEHDQWFILRAGAGGLTYNYSVNDAEGEGTTKGFDFELL